MLSFTIGYGGTIGNFGLLNQVLVGMGYSEPSDVIKINALTALISGALSTVVFSRLIRKHAAVKKFAVMGKDDVSEFRSAWW